MDATQLTKEMELPLTCSRSGTCCHGNLVTLNPWELALLATEKGMPVRSFSKQFTTAGGSILSFLGSTNQQGKKACLLFQSESGCSVYNGRPLACRLFPLARFIQNEKVTYIHQGKQFPCFKECPEVNELPKLTVGDYLTGQQTSQHEMVHDAYLEVMQNCADIALTLLLETPLKDDPTYGTLSSWKSMGNKSAEQLSQEVQKEWLDLMMFPVLSVDSSNPEQFVSEHNEWIQEKAQSHFSSLQSMTEIHETALAIMGMSLFLAHALGADAKGLSEWWIQIATDNGAL